MEKLLQGSWKRFITLKWDFRTAMKSTWNRVLRIANNPSIMNCTRLSISPSCRIPRNRSNIPASRNQFILFYWPSVVPFSIAGTNTYPHWNNIKISEEKCSYEPCKPCGERSWRMAPHSLTNPTATYISRSSSYDQHSHTHVSAFTCPDLGINKVKGAWKAVGGEEYR
jgi:hypothetical protein